MKHVTFTLRTLTPLFIAGADQTKAELRSPTFRGLMRYWLRALIGGMVGTGDEGLKAVIEQEAKVFGATDTGSAVTIRVSNSQHAAAPYHRESTGRSGTGKDYLLWSMEQFRNKPRRQYFPEGTEFQVILSTHEDDIRLKQAIASFWLLTHLAGIGSRSRRCAGSMTAQGIDGNLVGFRFDVPKDVEDLQNQISEGIKLARQWMRQSLSGHDLLPVTQASFDALAQKTCEIWILRQGNKVWRTPDDAMQAIGSNLQSYRSSLPLHSRTIFGLPLMGIDNRSRCASPLLLRIVELQGDTYVGLAVLFKTGNNQNYTLIENWANSFSGKVVVTL